MPMAIYLGNELVPWLVSLQAYHRLLGSEDTAESGWS